MTTLVGSENVSTKIKELKAKLTDNWPNIINNQYELFNGATWLKSEEFGKVG